MLSLKSQHLRLMAPFLVMAAMSCFSLNYLMMGMKRHLFFIKNGLDPYIDSDDQLNVTSNFDSDEVTDSVRLTQEDIDSLQKALPKFQSNESAIAGKKGMKALQKGVHDNKKLGPEDANALENFVLTESRQNHTIITWREVKGMQTIINRYWSGTLFCEINKIRSALSDPNHPISVLVSFGCKELYDESFLGTGNYINLLYGIRLAAHVHGNIDVNFTCYDANETKKDLILPWMMGYFPPREAKLLSRFSVTRETLCKTNSFPSLSHMYKEIQYDFRKMAIGLMGVPHPDHPSALFAEQYLWATTPGQDSLSTMGSPQIPHPQRNDLPPFPVSEFDLDDAVLHFRCGDLMDSTNPNYAFMTFSGYTRHISQAAKSIGILTQPFDDILTQGRKADADSKKRDRCRIVVHSLVEFIVERYPNAKVRIRNSVDDTIALTYARMIMANQAIAGISSFGVIPAIATFGTGYLREPDYPKAPQSWVLHPRIDELADNIVLFKEPIFIKVEDMKELWETQGETGVLKWFWEDTFVFTRQNKSAIEGTNKSRTSTVSIGD